MKQAVKLFYQKYNPAKISEIDEILDPYEGDEIVMLRILCNKYGVSHEIMQQFLDKATQVSNPFIFHHKDSSNNSNASLDSDEIEVDWNLKDVHIPTVVNSFYKAYCPGKTPRQSEIEKVPASESASFLLQLCYNFNVHPEQMYPLIEAARRNGPTLPSSADTTSATNEFNTRGRSNSNQRNLRHTNGDDASSTGSIANSLSSTGRHRAPPPPPPPPLMTTQVNPAGSKAPIPVANFIEVPQTFFNPSRRPSLKLGDGDSDNNIHGIGSSHAAKAAETPQLASQPRNNSGGVMEKKAIIAVDSIEESAPTELDSGSSSLRQATSDLTGKGSHQRKPSTLKVKLHGGEGDEPTVTQVFSEASTEIEKMKSELEITRQQLKEVCMESQAVLKILKDNSTELERSKSAGRRSSELPATLKPDGALTGDASNESMRQQMEDMNAEYYKKCDLLVAQNDLLQKRNEELSVALHSARTTLDAALSDRRDLLELIDVVSSAASNGINFNTILEAYLTKLGLSTADLNSPGKANGNYSGPKKTIGSKIADALEWKRAQMRNTILSKTSTAEDIRLPSPSLSRPQQLYEQSQGDGNDDESEEVKNPYDASSVERGGLERLHVGGFAKKSVSNGFLVSEGSSSKVGGELYGRPSQQADDSTNDRIDMQYDLARKAHLHAVSHAKLAAQLATQNLTTTQKGINAEKLASKSSDTRTPQSFSPAPRKVASNENLQQSSSKLGSTSSELHYQQQLARHQQTPEEMVTDWKECFDPRTNRKYYYSPSLKKSMWNDPTKPGSRNGTPKAASSSRYKSPNAAGGDHSNRSTAGKAGALTRSNSSDFLTRSNNSSRNTSPALSTTAIPTSTKRAGASDTNGDVWVMAVDAKSNRYYWYNRQTKVSTWRKPAVP